MRSGRLLALLFLFPLIFAWSAAQAVGEDPLSPLIRERVERLGSVSAIPCRAERACGSRIIREFYRKRAYRPVWSSAGRALPQARAFIQVIGSAQSEGLRPEDYHFDALNRLFEQAFGDPEKTSLDAAADCDLLFTNVFFVYGAHILSGRVDPRDLFRNWSLDERGLDLSSVLEEVVRGRDVREALASLRPQDPRYVYLIAALSRYRSIEEAGGWRPVVMKEKRLKRGDHSPAVDAIRKRLRITGELRESSWSHPDLFDDALDQAVRAFQKRHGLAVDGVVGPKTLAALNVPADARVRQIDLNLERMRWLPETLGRRYLLLNIADFSLTAWQGGEKRFEMKAIVGRAQRQTPLLSSTIDTVILNPAWNVPHSIAVKDLLPAIRKDPGLLARKGFRVFSGWGANAREIDPSGIDWRGFSERDFPFRLLQDPGPENALGNMKFSFPNTESVYLHGTPARNLFMKSRRDFSSGCIRVEDPLALAVWILDGQGPWNREKLAKSLYTGQTRSIPVRRPVPIHVLYLTAWAEPDGTVHFRSDLYGQDALLARALGIGD